MKSLILIFAAIFALTTPVWAEVPNMDLKGRNIIYHSDFKLSGTQKRDLRDARKADFFGAVAVNTVNKTYDASGAAWGYNDLKSAQETALRSCQFKADKPADCILYLSVVPKGYDINSRAATLSKSGVDAYNYLVDWARVNVDSYRSMAVHGIHTWAYSAAHPSRAAAEKDALQRCENTHSKAVAKKDPAWVNAVYSKRNLKCRVFQTFGPK